MALERVPADIRVEGGVARMSDPNMIKDIMNAVTIPVMAKARIGHFVECQVRIDLPRLTVPAETDRLSFPVRSSKPLALTTLTNPKSSLPPTISTMSPSTTTRSLSSADAVTSVRLCVVSLREQP